MRAVISWAGEALFVAESGSGHSVVVDGPPEAGGRNVGIRPMELVLLGLGSCTAYDVVSILRKARQDVRHCTVEIEAKRADSPPRVFTSIHVRYFVRGKGLLPQQVERAIRLSGEKYCSASIMLGKTAGITHEFEIFESD